MNSPKEFLEALAEELRFLPAKEVNEILKHYKDRINVEIDYGTPLEKIFENLKTPEEIAKGIYDMHGVDYVKKRKTATKIVDRMVAVFCSLLILACLTIFIVGLTFIGTVLINQISLIGHTFKFKQALDTVVTTISILAYMVVMICTLIYIIDLFIILINSLLKKVLNSFKKTRGKYFAFMDFTLTNFFNQITKTNKFILKILTISAVVFAGFSITSYATKGYMYRAMNNINSSIEEIEIEKEVNQILVNATNTNFIITEDENVDTPLIKYEYELTKMYSEINGDTLEINIDKKKIYDILGLIKSPVPTINIILPIGYDLNKINLNIEYGNLIFKNLTSTDEIITVTSSGSVSLGENINLKKVNIELYDGTLVSNKNQINELIVNQKTGKLNAGEDQINKFTHTNGSSEVTVVNSYIEEYSLTNASGTIYLEKLSGNNFSLNSTTSVNYIYDFNYDTAKILAQNTSNINLIRSYFRTSVEVTTVNNSYQTIEYVKSPKMTFASATGLISCSEINVNYKTDEIMKLPEEYRSYATIYNGYSVDNSEIFIETNKADVTINNVYVHTFKYSQLSAASLIENIFFEDGNIEFKDTASNIKNLYGNNLILIVDSTNYTSKSSIDLNNNELTEGYLNTKLDKKYNKELYQTLPNLEINIVSIFPVEIKIDGMSELVTSENIEKKYIN